MEKLRNYLDHLLTFQVSIQSHALISELHNVTDCSFSFFHKKRQKLKKLQKPLLGRDEMCVVWACSICQFCATSSRKNDFDVKKREKGNNKGIGRNKSLLKSLSLSLSVSV